MRKVKESYKIMTPISKGGMREMKRIEKIARICYKSEDKISKDGSSAVQMVRMLVKKGHDAMLEHVSLSIKFTVDRGVSHEIVRHRIASYAQESTRYVNYSGAKAGNQCTFIDLWNGMQLDPKVSKLPKIQQKEIYMEWIKAMEDAENHYLRMCYLGATPQIARSVLPNSTKTEIVMTANLREWRNFFRLRVPETAHPQMREVTTKLYEELRRKMPEIFNVFGDLEEVAA